MQTKGHTKEAIILVLGTFVTYLILIFSGFIGVI
jgi:hypothetical protein